MFNKSLVARIRGIIKYFLTTLQSSSISERSDLDTESASSNNDMNKNGAHATDESITNALNNSVDRTEIDLNHVEDVSVKEVRRGSGSFDLSEVQKYATTGVDIPILMVSVERLTME